MLPDLFNIVREFLTISVEQVGKNRARVIDDIRHGCFIIYVPLADRDSPIFSIAYGGIL